jgi:hypothetical protein
MGAQMITARRFALICMAMATTVAYATPAFAQFEAETAELTGPVEQAEGESGSIRYPGTTEGVVTCGKIAGTWALAEKLSPTLTVQEIKYEGCTAELGAIKEAAEFKCPKFTIKQTGKVKGENGSESKADSSENNEACFVKTSSGCEIVAPAQVIPTENTTVHTMRNELLLLLWHDFLLLHTKTVKAKANLVCQLAGLTENTKTALLHVITKSLRLRQH